MCLRVVAIISCSLGLLAGTREARAQDTNIANTRRFDDSTIAGIDFADGRFTSHDEMLAATKTASGWSDECPGDCNSADGCDSADDCDADACCDRADKKDKLAAAVAGSHKGVFYANDFSYVTDPNYNDWWPGDNLKQLGVGHLLTFDFGGQYRMRQHSERNIRGLGLTGVDDDFLLHRTRLFGNMRVGDRLRFYAEYIDAVSNYEDFRPRPIEENRSDFLGLFVDGTLLEFEEGTLSGRAGRQELLYGAQRAVSPLDWANTRRTFDGGKLMWSGENWDVDGFWTRPVLPTAKSFDNPATNLQFYGVYSNYKGFESDEAELYWLAFDNDITGLRVDSLGGRYLGKLSDQWSFEFWGNYQFGRDSDDSGHSAGAWTCGIGRTFDHCWKPAIWVYYDWASGGERLGAGDGYFQFFPLAHKYLGFMDLFGRNNIESPNVLFTMQPTDKLKVLLWYYYLFLETRNDTPYSVASTPFAPGVAPSSSDLGHEIDLLFSYSLNARSSLLFGYSHFFSGKYYDNPAVPFGGDADFFYTQYQFNF